MRAWYRYCRYLCWALFTVCFRGRVFGRENVPLQGGVLLLCNHQSFLDPVLATYGLNRECHYMARDSLFRNKYFRRLIESLNAFPIRRGAADLAAIRESIRRLKGGGLLTAFPEGTRTPDGCVQAMHAGAVLIARRAGVPIVPTLILGAYEAWPRQQLSPRPLPIIVAYGAALTPKMIETMTDEDVVTVVRSEILKLAARYRDHATLRGRLSPHSGLDALVVRGVSRAVRCAPPTGNARVAFGEAVTS